MKKLLVMLSVGVLVLGMAGCGNDDGGSSSQPQATNTPGGVETSEPTTDPGSAADPGSQGEESEQPFDVSNGWSEEMTNLRQAVVNAVGEENYWPNMPLLDDVSFFESRYGLSSDQYLDFLAEIPMISTNVDTLVIVKARPDKVADVEAALNAYRDSQVNGALQYPQNQGKVQASKVETIGYHVVFVMLGGDPGDSVEDSIVSSQQANDQAIEAIRQMLEG